VEIELYSLLALAILLTSVATVLFALFTYILFRVRESRKLKKQAAARHSSSSPAPSSAAPAGEPSAPPAEGAAAAEPPPPPKAAARPRFFKPYQPTN